MSPAGVLLVPLSLGLRLLAVGLLGRVLLVGLYQVCVHFAPEVIDRVGNQFFLNAYDLGLQLTWGLLAGGYVLVVSAPRQTRATMPFLLTAAVGACFVALEGVERFALDALPERWVPHLQILAGGLILLSAYFACRGAARLHFWLSGWGQGRYLRSAAVLNLLSLILWVGRFALEQANPQLLRQVPAVGRFDGPMVVLYCVGLFAGLSLLLSAPLLMGTASTLGTVREGD